MTDQIAGGVIRVTADASDFIAEMARMEAAAKRAERTAVDSAGRASGAGSSFGKGAGAGVDEFDAATKRYVRTMTSLIASSSLEREELLKFQAAMKGVSTEVSGPYIKALLDAEKAQTALKNSAASIGSSLNLVGVSAGQTKAALAQLPAQITDIVTSLQGGQRPLTVLLQQGGQIKDSFGGVGNAFRALGSFITPTTVALGGAALAAGIAAFAFNEGQKETLAYAKALVLTGNAAGTTVGQLNDMAKAVSAGVGSQGKAAEVLADLASSGQVAAGQFQKLADAAIRMERAGGASASETAKQFAALGKDPVQAVMKLNEQTNFLTKATFDQIKALQDQGKEAEAAKVAQVAYADAVAARADRLEGSIGTLDKTLRAAKDGWHLFWDAAYDVGRPDTLEDKIAKAKARVETAAKAQKSQYATGSVFYASAEGRAQVEADKETISKGEKELETQRLLAEMNRESAESIRVATNLEKDYDASLSYRGKLAKDLLKFDNEAAIARKSMYGKELEEFNERNARARTYLIQNASATQQGNALTLAGIEERKQAVLDATKAQTEALQQQAKAGLITDFSAERDISALRLEDNKALIDALVDQRKVLASQREPAEALKKNQNEINAAVRERVRLYDTQARFERYLVEQAERRVQTPTEQFQALEKPRNYAADQNQEQQRIALNFALFEQAKALKDVNEQYALEASMLGKSAEERSLAVQQLRIEQQYREQVRQIIEANPIRQRLQDDGVNYLPDEADTKARADALAEALARKNDLINGIFNKANIDLAADLLDPTRPKLFGEALTKAFEGAGDALVKLSNTFENYAAQQYKLSAALKGNRDENGNVKSIQTENALLKEQGDLQLKTYADATGAAKGFFNEGSRGYKALEAAETAFRAVQVASAFARGIADAAAAIAHQGTGGDPYSAFARMAAMAAIVASLGYATGFLGSSGSSDVAGSSQRQGGAATGRVVTTDQTDRNSSAFVRGTVLGDDAAKSESISRSLEHLSDKADLTLPLTNQMATYLRSIAGSMSGLAAVIVRTVGLTAGQGLNIDTGRTFKPQGAFGTTDPALSFITSINPGARVLSNFAFGGSKREIIDTGLDISGTINDLLVRSFADVTTTKKGFLGGLFGGNSTTTSPEFGTVSKQLEQQVGLIFQDIGRSATAAASALGGNAEELAKKVADFYISIPRLSLKDLKGEELQSALSAAFGAQADTIAATVLPGLEDFQKVGEGYYETLVRVASGVEEAQQTLDSLGVSAVNFTDVLQKQGDVAAEITRQSIERFETVGGALSNVGKLISTLGGDSSDLAGAYRQLVDIREALILVGQSGATLGISMIRGAGSVDALASSLSNYFEKFFTPQEQAAANTARLAKEFEKLGLAMPATREEFRNLAQGLNDGTDAGAKLFAQVIGLADAFNDVADAAEAAAKRLAESISDSIKRFGTPQERQGEAFGGIATSLRRDAGVSVSISQLIGASIEDINDFARAFLSVSTNSDAAKAALLDAANALFDLKKEAADQRGSLDLELLRAQGRELQAVAIERQAEIDQLRNLEASLGVAAGTFVKLQEEIYAASDAAKLMAGLKNIVPDFLSGKDLASFRAQQVQSTLAGAGINVTIDQILSATGKQIRELFEAVGPAGKQAIVDVYDEVTQLQTDLTKEQRKSLEDQLTGMKGLRDLAHQMKDYVSTLKFGDLSPLSAQAQLTEAKSLFQSTLTKALGGDTQAQGNLQGVAQALLSEAQGAFASGPAYTAIFQQVTGALEALGLQGDALDPQIKYLESLSDNSRSMLDALLSIDTTLKGGTSTPTGTGGGDYVSGPPGSSGGLSGPKGEVVDIAPMRWPDTTRQTELLEQTLAKLDQILASSKETAAAASGNVAVDQLGFNKVAVAVDALRGPLDQLAGTARQANNKANIMPVTANRG